MRMRIGPRLSVLALAVGLVAAACSSGNGGSSSTTAPAGGSPSASESEGGTITIGSDNANDHGTKDVSGMDEASVELDDFYFEPTILKGTAGQQITVELENQGSALHNFTLSEQSIDQDVQPGGKETVTVTFPDSGQLEFFCKYHKGSGMVGALEAG